MHRRVNAILTTVLLVAVAGVGLSLLRGRVVEDIYRERLRALSDEYESLRRHYNEAVEKTAVTELRVEGGRLSVDIVTAAGLARTIETPFDPREEIHVDYVVIDGRLWIRRIHDASTPATQAMLIDPTFTDVDWDEDGKRYGLTIYRPLSDGRWVVNATANGALTLVRTPSDAPVELAAPPEIRDYEQVESELDGALEEIGWLDVLAGAT
jgi:hypothetical protein